MYHLKRPDGTKYKGNLYKTVKGSLTSNGIFKKTIEGAETFWVVNKVIFIFTYRILLTNLKKELNREYFTSLIKGNLFKEIVI